MNGDLFFGRVGSDTRVTLKTMDGKTYPTASGNASRKLKEACGELCGRNLNPSAILSMLKDLL